MVMREASFGSAGSPRFADWLLNAASVTALDSSNSWAHSLKERLGDVEGVNLVGLGHNRVLGLDVAFRHGGCAAVVSFWYKESSVSARKGRKKRAGAFNRPEVGELGLSDNYKSQCRVKGSAGLLIAAGAQIEAAGDKLGERVVAKVELRRVIRGSGTADSVVY